MKYAIRAAMIAAALVAFLCLLVYVVDEDVAEHGTYQPRPQEAPM